MRVELTEWTGLFYALHLKQIGNDKSGNGHMCLDCCLSLSRVMQMRLCAFVMFYV